MTDKTRGGRGPRRAAALTAVAAAAALTACSGSPAPSGGSGQATDHAASSTYQAELAYAHCMQTHGVPGFPDPRPSMHISISGQPPANSPAGRANAACKHLLSG